MLNTAALQRASREARELAERANNYGATNGNEWSRDLEGWLGSHFPDERVPTDLADHVADSKVAGQLLAAVTWLRRNAWGFSKETAPQARAELLSAAGVIDATLAKAPPNAIELLPNAIEFLTGPDALVVGDWIVGRAIDRGGQGEVSLSYNKKTLERGALKQMVGRRASTPKARERFAREIAAFRLVSHPCVARVLDYCEEDPPFLVMEIAAFGSLHRARKAFRGDLWRSLRMARDVASGLEAVHAAKLVHRDIKPKNILLATLDHALVADFGIAHFEELDTVTSVGSHPGAFLFAPPEYELHDQPTPAFDVFSLGAVLRWAVTAEEPKQPYRVTKDLAPIQTVLADTSAAPIEELARVMMAEQPRDRPSATNVIARLDEVLRQLFGRAALPSDACQVCGSGTYEPIGAVDLGGATEITVRRPGKQGRSLHEFAPELQACSSCGVLRWQATRKPRERLSAKSAIVILLHNHAADRRGSLWCLRRIRPANQALCAYPGLMTA